MSATRSAAPFSRSIGRHRRPSRSRDIVPAGVTGGLLLASATTGLAAATAAPASAAEKPGAVPSSASTSSPDSSGSSTSSASHASQQSTDLPAYPGVLLTQGDTGDYVEMVQSELGVATDGIFGPVTENAVQHFQQNHDLVVDGIVGPHTWSSLRGGGSGGGASSDVVNAGYTSSSSEASSSADSAIAIAAAQEGDPYVYGAAGPDSFDCSGLVKYVFGKLGYDLPHSAHMQYDAVDHVSRGDLRPGDIVFLADSSGHIYHNGIYAGNGYWWVARHSGTTVTKQAAYWMDGGYDWHVGRVG